ERYSGYKDSGVDWIGEIPEHWEVKKLKAIIREHSGNGFPVNQQGNKSGKIPFYKVSDINGSEKFLTNANNYVDTISVRRHNWNLIPINSIVAAKIGEALRKNHRKITTVKAIIDNNCIAFEPVKIEFKYNYYLHKTIDFDWFSNPGAVPSISVSMYKNFYVSLPPLQEQKAIANFLDEKTSKIDTAITQKEQMISLLKERKQILIQNAVTKGIDPAAKMKDSGVEWIGKIPKGWKILPNKVLFQESKASGNDTLPLLSVSLHSGISSGELGEEENIRGKVKIEDKSSYKLVRPHYIAYNMMRAWQGAIGAVAVDGMVSPAYVVAIPNNLINSVFFEFQYRTSSFIQQMNRFSKGITDFRKRLYWNEFKQLNTIVPPLRVQKKIVDFIETESVKIDTSIELQQQQITKLKEYKTILIDHAVTGKIKVT
ncbi:MAG: restriction endonuclease subunit S, partial [Candidatus Electrothrix sp. AR3]|nr:restriction endonuclease subunit S [Candidatus Electrothrix sp. AR3]